MKKCLILIALLLLTQVNNVSAQHKLTASEDSLFFAPDTVCVNQPVTLKNNVLNAASYYWGFCSGYLKNAPTGTNLGKKFNLHLPTNIDIINDSGIFYGFAINSETREFLRYNFGNSLNNVPTITNFDSLKGGLPVNPTSLYILKDTFSHNWYIFVSGGFTRAKSTLGRIDFGPHLGNPRPNVANFGNYNNLLNYPKGLFVAQDGSNNWYGYLVNQASSELIKLDFSFNVSNTPLMENLGNISDAFGNPVLNGPSDIAAIRDKGNWFFFVTNAYANTVARLDIGPDLGTPTPGAFLGTSLGDFNFRINYPTSITINRDCGELYAYVIDSTTSQLVGIQMPEAIGPYYAIDYNNVGLLNFPSSISSIIRDRDNLYGFVVNPRDSTLTKIDFSRCGNSSIPSFTEVTPPVHSYNLAGLYNIYYVIDQGLPTQRVNCKPIRVLPNPPINMNMDTTICQGDTIKLYTKSNLADSIQWFSDYNIDTTYIFRDSVKVWPYYTTEYPVILYYPFGCVVDTQVRIHVSRVKADAGPDRWIRDGVTSTLGGAYTTRYNSITLEDGMYNYRWYPFEFMSDSTVTNPVVNPPYDYTYYLEVTELNDTFKCKSIDTVTVRVNCGDIVLPNAFSPNSTNAAVNRFGILNNQIVKLNYFRIYDRWGVLVFETNNVTEGWDGTYNGKIAPVGVYVWTADAFCSTGKSIKKQGNVTLMR